MRLIRRFLMLAIVGVAGVAAYAYWSDNGPSLRERAADTAGDAADKINETMSDGALTAKLKSKMALDDHVKARAIDVDTSDSVATLSGIVASADERKRAVQLARDTEGITRVVDELEIRRP